MAAEADADRVGFGQAGLVAGMRAVAVGAITHGAGMGHFRAFDELGLVVMTGQAEGLRVGLGEHDFAILCRCVAELATLRLEGRMHESGHEFGRV